MPEITFTVKGNPRPQQRHRTGRGFNYDPSSADKADFLSMIQHMAPKEVIRGAIEMDFIFGFARPKSHYGTGKNSGKLKDSAPNKHISKPDKDNLEKLIMDCMEGIFFKNDAQIYKSQCTKFYSESPSTKITMRY